MSQSSRLLCQTRSPCRGLRPRPGCTCRRRKASSQRPKSSPQSSWISPPRMQYTESQHPLPCIFQTRTECKIRRRHSDHTPLRTNWRTSRQCCRHSLDSLTRMGCRRFAPASTRSTTRRRESTGLWYPYHISLHCTRGSRRKSRANVHPSQKRSGTCQQGNHCSPPPRRGVNLKSPDRKETFLPNRRCMVQFQIFCKFPHSRQTRRQLIQRTIPSRRSYNHLPHRVGTEMSRRR